MEYSWKKEKKEIFVYRPKRSIDINPVKKTPKDLEDAYNLGYEDGINRLNDLKKFLK